VRGSLTRKKSEALRNFDAKTSKMQRPMGGAAPAAAAGAWVLPQALHAPCRAAALAPTIRRYMLFDKFPQL
jgi:hypothetical protein